MVVPLVRRWVKAGSERRKESNQFGDQRKTFTADFFLQGHDVCADGLIVFRDPYSLLGKYVLVGITRVADDGTLLEKFECHGRIALVDGDAGIKVVRSDGEVLTLPPDLDSFREAKPGIYRLRSTGEEIVDPDLTTVWTIREPPSDD